MRKKRMAATLSSPSLSLQQINKDPRQHGVVIEEIEGLIRVHEDGHVERPVIVPCVAAGLGPELSSVITSRDMVIDKFTNLWARFYVPICHAVRLPLLVYFHGGGFCVGSAAWSCYHEFLARLAAKIGCLIMSVNYRLAPENPLPAAYDDGLKALMWLKQQVTYQCEASEWWSKKCNFSSIFLAGDSAGANIAYNVATRLSTNEAAATLRPLSLEGLILVQPYFGGEVRTNSEKYMVQSPHSALNLVASDTYWRLALPSGTNRDHPWCNPLGKGSVKLEELRALPILVCIAEMDILKDRNLEFCAALGRAGKRVEFVVYKSVGHAFQVLSSSQLSQSRTQEMMAHFKNFIGR
ncbi:Alpha/beta hydrolase-3 [Quillaja saponaria]|uniref:Alpha/beta hydrolase-3 n=1 Tax=Quillaja saponaria TaxID=32244 RepID=A0AAD7PGH8_QUISA|nr:Alpha/beta hydrolase-3 [Quillaja saponaria]